MQVFFGWLSQVVLAMALPYFLISLVLGVCVARRNGLRLGSQEAGPVVTATRASGHALYFLVPCLNEEVVVTETVRRLLAEPGGVVVVIDDGSTDRTAARAEAAAGAAGAADRLIVVSRAGAPVTPGQG